MVAAAAPAGTADAAMARLFPQPDRYLEDPVGWNTDRLGGFFWSKQRDIAVAVRDHRYVAVHSCHDSGKSFEAAQLVAWWLDVHPIGSAFAVTTAPTDPQVKAILWREIAATHRKAGLPGRITLDARWYMGSEENELVAYGRKPADYDQAAFQGIHARHVLIVIDEAGGVPKTLFDAVDSLATNEGARVLAIGNPDDPSTHFADICKPGSGWHTIHIDGLDTPNFTGEAIPDELGPLLLSPEWVEERKRRWGEQSPLYVSKVRGLFPEVSDDVLISPAMIREAQQRDLSAGHFKIDAGRYGYDIGEFGEDETAGYLNRGGVVRHVYTASRQDTMRTTGAIAAEAGAHPDRAIVVDKIGVGSGVWSRLREQGFNVHGFGAGERAIDPQRFVNRRAEAWWSLRLAFQEELVDLDPEDDELAAELQAPKWWRDSRGRVVVESKDAMKKRGVASPNRADAVVMSFVAPEILPPAPETVRPAERAITSGVLDEPM